MTSPPDLAARVAAARTFDRNVVVVAGAGSGKTTLLVERLLNLVLGRGVPLPSVLALTFTEKAASEMRARLASQLSRVLEIAVSGERAADPASFSLAFVAAPEAEGGLGVAPAVVRERALRALHDLDGASIGTIHAACADLLRRHPAAARLDPAFVVDDGSRTARVLEDEWTAFQARTLQEDAPEAAAWRHVLSRLDATVVLEAAGAVLESTGVPQAAGAAEADARLISLAAAMDEELQRIATIGAVNDNAMEWAAILSDRLKLVLGSGVAALKTKEKGDPPAWPTQKRPTAGKKCADAPFVEDVLDRALELTDAILASDDDLCDAVLSLARGLASRTRARLDEEGIVGFSELLVRARDVLLHDPAARRQVHGRIQALLLDEFQDTDPLQYEIAFLLAEDPNTPVPPGGDPWAAKLLPGRLFIVGDPKQSIYRFRGADMAAYERAIGLLRDQGALLLSLVANFRSRAEVLAPVNDLCSQLIVEEAPYQPAYENLVASRADSTAGERRVQMWSVRGGGNAEEWRLAEARCIASRVRGWRETGVISDYGRVVILLRAMTAGEAYQRALAEAGVPFVTQGGRGFFERQEIVQAIALLRCLTHPHDGAALLAILRSPSCGADDGEILRFADMTARSWSLSATASLDEAQRAQVPRVARTIDGLRALAAHVAELPADEAVRVALSEHPPGEDWQPHLLSLHAACRNGAQRLANVEKLAERAEGLARDEGLSLPRIVQRLEEELKEVAAHGESPLADESVNAVRIMTIHQAKGLEFDVVVVPDLAREKNPQRRQDVEIAVRRGVLGMRLPGGITNVAWVVLAGDDERHAAAEDLRIFYVALTRAKERLILVNGNGTPKSSCVTLQHVMRGWGYQPGTADGGAGLHAGLEHEALDVPASRPEDADVPAPAEELADAVIAQEASALVMEGARRPRPRSPSGMKEQREVQLQEDAGTPADAGLAQSADVRAPGRVSRDDAAARPARDRSVARAVGVAVHLALEAGTLTDAEGLVAIGRRAALLAADEGEADADDVARLAEPMLRRVATSAIARELAGATVLARELPFLMPGHEGDDWQGFVDLVVERDGETWVVDWKTDQAEAPERHREQLTVYAEAVRRWRGSTASPRIALAYVALGTWVVL